MDLFTRLMTPQPRTPNDPLGGTNNAGTIGNENPGAYTENASPVSIVGSTGRSDQARTPTPEPKVMSYTTPPMYTPIVENMPKPIMGDIIANSDGSNYVWVGGKPNVSWTHLDSSVLDRVPQPGRHRYLKDAKYYEKRIAGADPKYTAKDDLRQFCRKVFEHFKYHGLDTITYLPDPANPGTMESVVEKPNLFTKEYVMGLIPTYTRRYDRYDDLNEQGARLYLVQSLDPELERRVTSALATTSSPSFLLTWMTFIEKIRILSVGRVTNLQKQVEERKPTQYAGQNLEKMAYANILDLVDLSQAGWFSLSTGNEMVRNFASANPECPEFRQFAYDILTKYKAATQKCFHKNSTEATNYMESEGLGFEELCNKFADYYRAAHQDGHWLPSKNVRDTRGVPSNFANKAQKPRALTLTPNSGAPSTAPSGNCHVCGKSGHWARNCPSKPTNSSSRTPSSPVSWSRTAPAPGSSETKTMHGKTFHWCGRCKRWTTTHGTAQHKSKSPESSSSPSVSPAQTTKVNFTPTYTAWNCCQFIGESKTERLVAVGMEKLWSYFGLPLVWSFIFTFGLLSVVSMIPYVLMVVDVLKWGTLAPISWLVSFCLFLIFQKRLSAVSPPPVSPTKPFTRKQKREFGKLLNKEMLEVKAGEKSRSSQGFHRTYPLRLRSNNRYYRRSPQVLLNIRKHNAIQKFLAMLPPIKPVVPVHRQFARRVSFSPNTSFTPSMKRFGTKEKHPKHPFSPPTQFDTSTKRFGGKTQCDKKTIRSTQDSFSTRFGQTLFQQSKKKPIVNPPRMKYFNDSHQWPEIDRRTFSTLPQKSKTALGQLKIKVKMFRPHRIVKSPIEYRFQQTEKREPQVPLDFNSMRINVALHAPTNPTLRQHLIEYAPSWFRAMFNKVATKHTVVWDSGASMSVSPCRDDFVGEFETFTKRPTLKGISDQLVEIHGKGNVSWTFEDTNGMLRTLKVPCLYVPKINQRLLSTTSLLTTYPSESLRIEESRLVLSGTREKGCGPIEAYIDPENNLPTSDMFDHSYSYKFVDRFEAMTTVVSNDNYNLSEPEKELLRWHQRLAHIDFNKVKFLFRTGVLARSEASRTLQTAASKLKSHPRCAACQFGKQCQASVPTTTTGKVSDSVGAISRDCTRPGQLISVDHFVCKTKGRLFSSRGKTTPSDMYCGGCVFVDNFSGMIHIELQKNLNTHETLEAKAKFEAMALDSGVIPQSYLSDNGPAFTSQEFANRMKQFEQVSKFAGAGAHHHNGVAERSIRTVISIARTMMMHAAIHWPEVSDPTLWPMAVKYAAHVYNRMPHVDSGLCPIDTFSRQRWKQTQFHDMHVWGCPVYVLDKRIADGIKIPKWSPRSNRFIYMGVSDKHSSTVPLLLNPESGVISPQFHVVIDEWFATIGTSDAERPDFNSETWTKMFGESKYQYIWDDEEEDNVTEPTNFDEVLTRNDRIEGALETYTPPTPLPVADPPTSATPASPHRQHFQSPNRFTPLSLDLDHDDVPPFMTDVDVPPPSLNEVGATLPLHEQRELPLATPNHHPPSPMPSPSPPPTVVEPPSPPSVVVPPASEPSFVPVPLRRSVRNRRVPDRLNLLAESNWCFNIEHTPYGLASPSDTALLYLHEALLNTIPQMISASTLVSADAFKASLGDPDTFTYDEAMADKEHADEWRMAAHKEIQALEKHGTWIIDEISNATSKVLPGTWVFRRKRAPDGSILKYKARYCVRGDLQEQQNETYAPVVHWSTIRLFLILSMLLGWDTTTIDFSQAFVQASLAEPVWIHLPRGFHSDDELETQTKRCLKLLKSLYGLSEAPRLWYLHLFNALINDLGFTQSTIDPCLLLKKDMMIVIFVDDCAISYKNKKDYDGLVADLRALNFELTEEGPFTKFLGIQFTRTASAITMTQSGLIDQIAAATGLTDANPNHTPTSHEAIGKDATGTPMKEQWNYRSIIGMLLYLSTNTRPDIAFAVSQAARFSNQPMQSHATAVKTIVRYLVGTKDKGTVVNPTGKLDIQLYVDADFAGLFKKEANDDPNSARSRTGYILLLGGFPLIWKSHLQTEISLSTLESEYSALSSATRALIPIRELLFEIADMIALPSELTTTIVSTIFEDNQGAYLLGSTQRITSRTRYFLVKYHHFWIYIQMEEGNKRKMYLEKVSTHCQGSDFLTKGLPRIVFQRNRLQILGW